MKARTLATSVLAGIVLTTTLGASGIASANPIIASGANDDNQTAQEDTTPRTDARSVATTPQQVSTLDSSADRVSVVGVSWKGENPNPEVRSLKDGKWSSWEKLEAEDDGPDANSAEGKQAAEAEASSEAIPVAGAEKIQVRSASKTADTSNMQVKTTSTEVTDSDDKVAAEHTNTSGTDNLTKSGTNEEGSFLKATAQSASTNVPGFGNIVTRKQWGANEKLVRCKTDQTNYVKGIYLHHTSGSNSYSRSQAPAIIRSYLAFHTQDRKWCDIGYNFLVDKYGTVYEGRAGSIDKAITGAHASGFNSGTLGISVLGTYNGAPPSKSALSSVKRVIAWKAKQYGFDPTGKMTLTSGGGSTSKYQKGKKVTLNVISGHKDTSYTDCPGTSYYKKLPTIRKEVKAMLKSAPKTYPTTGAIGTYYSKHRTTMGKSIAVQHKLSSPAGYYQKFEKGTVYSASKAGTHSVLKANGAVDNFKRVGYEKKVGFPTADQRKLAKRSDATYQTFEKALLMKSKAGSSDLRGGILSKWKSLGWERGMLGLPKAGGEHCKLVGNGCYQNFEKGKMYYSPQSGTHAIKGNILSTWAKKGYERGSLGYPTSEEKKTGSTYKQSFQHGYITWSSKGGVIHLS